MNLVNVTLKGAIIDAFNRLNIDNTVTYDMPASDNRYYEINPFPLGHSHLNACSEVEFYFLWSETPWLRDMLPKAIFIVTQMLLLQAAGCVIKAVGKLIVQTYFKNPSFIYVKLHFRG